MDEFRQTAFRILLYEATLRMRSLKEFGTSLHQRLNPRYWNQQMGEVYSMGTLAVIMSGLASQLCYNYSNFRDDDFWESIAFWKASYPTQPPLAMDRGYTETGTNPCCRPVRELLGELPPTEAMPPRREKAYRSLICDGMKWIGLVTAVNPPSWNNLAPLNWHRSARQIQCAGAIADWLHNLTYYSAIRFQGFREDLFWEDYDRLKLIYPEFEFDHEFLTRFEHHQTATLYGEHSMVEV